MRKGVISLLVRKCRTIEYGHYTARSELGLGKKRWKLLETWANASAEMTPALVVVVKSLKTDAQIE